MSLPEIPPPSGYGPWTVMLAVNVHPKPVKKTEILLHTYCELLIYIMNQQPRAHWVPVVMCGTFESWRDAVIFKDEWERPTRNIRNRIDRGWDLFQTYHVAHELVFWWQPTLKKDCVLKQCDALKQHNTTRTHPELPSATLIKRKQKKARVHSKCNIRRIPVGRVFRLEDKRRRVAQNQTQSK